MVSCMCLTLSKDFLAMRNAYITNPTIFGPDQHIEDKKRKRRMGSKSAAYTFYKNRSIIKVLCYLPCRCSTILAHDLSENLEFFDPSLTMVSSSGDNVIFFGPPVPYRNKHGKVLGKNSGSFESAN
jgi:hypothetical protein